ncbi:MAG: hypothetical protein RMN52_02295 [Anaerolineae bacterium]|nr:hypothetical protein [Candidatus Roseilinea sp.]MDW8448811.1 hypothetical protein [Anaerolineae bacterium]
MTHYTVRDVIREVAEQRQRDGVMDIMAIYCFMLNKREEDVIFGALNDYLRKLGLPPVSLDDDASVLDRRSAGVWRAGQDTAGTT